MNKVAAIILIVLGAAMLIWVGFSYTKKEKVIDLGALEVSVEKEETVNWPPYAGGIILVAGIVVLVLAKKG
jgi:hypothetical protein